ncbi:hypothetical protein BC793_10137 [Actinoplanes xinjiangensis]|uniref:Uncharacterized protein n=2 Tax=Actinoplanes xinjiangensis TaxID=512350 RepID=A0A316FTH0_9ACTN|nr:hypothetical protein BC793_10137 [Actinoplanes xinjiangensis]GIF37270.1 hypothetical protein Axi01nite_15810 [Actinoplanes xinjiangensis]
MPIDDKGRDWTADGRPVGWSANEQYVKAMNEGSGLASGVFVLLGWFFKLAVFVVALGLVVYLAARAWEFVATSRPDAGRYAASLRMADNEMTLDHIDVADGTVTFFFDMSRYHDMTKDVTLFCLRADEDPERHMGRSVRIEVFHPSGVSGGNFAPTDWECRGKEGGTITVPAGQPVLIWASYPLSDRLGLEIRAGYVSPSFSLWTEKFTITDLPKA